MRIMSFSWILVTLFLYFINSCAEEEFQSLHNGLENVLTLSKQLKPKRSVHANQGDLASAQEFFTTSVLSSLDILTRTQPRTLLIHTRLDQNDTLLLVRDNMVVNSANFQPSLYYNLATISHLPVTLVSILVPTIMETNASSDIALDGNTKKRLREFCSVLRNVSQLVNEAEVFVNADQTSRADKIIQNVSQLVNTSLESGSITTKKLNEFAQGLDSQLRENAIDAVLDYLRCLNNSTEEMDISGSYGNLSVVIALHPFAYPNSFLVQYYEQLLDVTFNNRTDPDRIILQPSQADEQHCSANYTEQFDSAEPSACAFSNASLQHRLSEIFNNGDATASVHTLLSQAAKLIYYENLTLPSCPSEQAKTRRVYGFQTRVERGYVILIIFFASAAVVFGIIVLCVFYEDRVMKRESMTVRLEKLKHKGPTVFTPVNNDAADSERSTEFSISTSEVHINHSGDTNNRPIVQQ